MMLRNQKRSGGVLRRTSKKVKALSSWSFVTIFAIDDLLLILLTYLSYQDFYVLLRCDKKIIPRSVVSPLEPQRSHLAIAHQSKRSEHVRDQPKLRLDTINQMHGLLSHPATAQLALDVVQVFLLEGFLGVIALKNNVISPHLMQSHAVAVVDTEEGEVKVCNAYLGPVDDHDDVLKDSKDMVQHTKWMFTNQVLKVRLEDFTEDVIHDLRPLSSDSPIPVCCGHDCEEFAICLYMFNPFCHDCFEKDDGDNALTPVLIESCWPCRRKPTGSGVDLYHAAFLSLDRKRSVHVRLLVTSDSSHSQITAFINAHKDRWDLDFYDTPKIQETREKITDSECIVFVHVAANV